MTLTADDLRRPAIRRIAHAITVLSTPVWIVPTLIAIVCGAVAFVFTLVAMGTDWLMRQVIRPLEELKWRAAEAYVKRWPSPINPADPLRQNVIYPVASGPTAKFRRYDTEPLPITPRPGDIDTRDSWGAGYSDSVAKARAAGTYRDTVSADPIAAIRIKEAQDADAAVMDTAFKYHELIMAISKKYPNETRHETALRYIRQAEQGSIDCAAAAKAN